MIILTDKPGGITSHDVVEKIKRASSVPLKIGHTGTLDPMCTGVLPVLTGKYTKLAELFPSYKTYKAKIKLGIKTDTQDITGTVISQKEVNVNINELEEVVSKFIGDIVQIPPMYSAVKIGGVRLYKLARKGIEVERKPREITIYKIETDKTENENEYELTVSCSSGTYIRTLCEDIGEKLNCGAVMTALRRIESNGFSITDSHSLESVIEYAQNGILDAISISCEEAFKDRYNVIMPSDGEKYYLNGGVIGRDRIKGYFNEETTTAFGGILLLRVYNEEGRFLGLGEYKSGYLKSIWNEFV
ncbi:MAG: truB [Clostridia bacterium]|nr:truB [Clostridia bacterium]